MEQTIIFLLFDFMDYSIFSFLTKNTPQLSFDNKMLNDDKEKEPTVKLEETTCPPTRFCIFRLISSCYYKNSVIPERQVVLAGRELGSRVVEVLDSRLSRPPHGRPLPRKKMRLHKMRIKIIKNDTKIGKAEMVDG